MFPRQLIALVILILIILYNHLNSKDNQNFGIDKWFDLIKDIFIHCPL
jgi:hypothetical protein